MWFPVSYCIWFSLITTLNPGGESGVILESNVPCGDLYADIIGLRLYYLSKFNFNVHCLSSQKNKFIGGLGSVLQSPAMKWFSGFGFLILLRFFNASLEELTGNILPGSDCIYPGRWMLCYPINESWD